jgi:hypothetical protein
MLTQWTVDDTRMHLAVSCSHATFQPPYSAETALTTHLPSSAAAVQAELSASLCSPTHQECPQQLLQQCGEDGSSQAQCQGHEEAAGTKPAAAGSPTLAFVYVKAGCSSRCSSDSAANMAMPVEQEPSTEQDDTAAADAHCNTAGSSQQQLQPAAEQAAAGKGKLQLCAGDSDILQQEEEQVNELASPPAAVVVGGVAAAAAAAAAAGQPAGVHRPSWLQRTFAKLLSCGSFSKMADV